VDRRSFLIRGVRCCGAGLAAAAGMAPAGGEDPEPIPSAGAATAAEHESGAAVSPAPTAPPSAPPDLVCARGDPAEALRRALDALGGIRRFVQPDQVVLVKPNAAFVAPPEWGATTHPAVLAALLELCCEAGARRILVVDHTLAPAERCFARTGIADAVAAFPKAKLASLDDERAYEPIDVPQGRSLRRTAVAGVVRRADVFINLPTAKSHSATGVSFGLKNLMGLVWDRQTFHHDMDVHTGVADLATVLRPHLTVLDAMVLLRTGGPAGPGESETFGGVVAGVDPVAVDAYAVGLTPWNRQTLVPEQVGFIKQAAQLGVGTLDLAALRILELA